MKKDRILGLLKDVYAYFSTIVIKDPYLSRFFVSFEQMPELIDKQIGYLARALSEDIDVFKLCKKAGDVHWRLKIQEDFLFEMIDFIKENVKNLNFYEGLELDNAKVDEIFQQIKNSTAKSYIEGILKESLKIFEMLKGSNFIVFHQYKFTEKLLGLVTSTDNFRQKDVVSGECSIDEWFKSPAFLVMFYSKKEIVPIFQFFHKNSHQYAEMVLDYLSRAEYVKALRMTRLFAVNSFLFVLYAIYLFSEWERDKEDVFFSFLVDPKFSEKTVSFMITPEEKKFQTDPAFVEFSDRLIEYVNTEYKSFMFGFSLKGKVYFVSSKSEYLENLDILKEAIEKVRLNLRESHISRVLNFRLIQVNVKEIMNRYKLTPHQLNIFFQIIAKKFSRMAGKYYILSPADAGDIYNAVDQVTRYECIVDKTVLNKENPFCKSYLPGKFEFVLFAQRIVDLQTGEDFGAECLVRIKSGREIIPAYKFIEFIRNRDLTKEMDIKVIKLVGDILGKIKKVDRIFINLFPSSYLEPEVLKKIEFLSKSAKSHGINVVFEITEYESTSNSNILKIIDDLGVDIALDDFGSGYANFERVATLSDKSNVMFIKVDGEIVKRILDGRFYRDVVEIVTFLSERLGKHIVYEYVENEKISQVLKDIAKTISSGRIKTLAQGYVFARPEPMENLF